MYETIGKINVSGQSKERRVKYMFLSLYCVHPLILLYRYCNTLIRYKQHISYDNTSLN